MKLFEAYYLLIFLSLKVASKELGRYAKPGCPDTCGNVTIPYPFGIGENCAVNKWYVVYCDSTTSTPYLDLLNDFLEIVGVNLSNQTINVIDTFLLGNLLNNFTINLRSPFWLSAPDNIFVFEGCGNATMMMDDGSTVLTGCSTTCLNCGSGNNSCHTTIPQYLKSYNIEVHSVNQAIAANPCEFAFVIDTTSFINRTSYMVRGNYTLIDSRRNFPRSLLWTLSENDYDKVTCSCGFGRAKLRVSVGNGTSVDTWKCRSYSSYSGNPYLKDGCYETTVIQYTTDACLNYCRDNGSYCDDSDTIYNINGSVYKEVHYCHKRTGKSPLGGVVLGFQESLAS